MKQVKYAEYCNLKKYFKRNGEVELHPFYKKYPISLSFNLIENSVMISKKYKFAYFRIAKAANSTVVASLYNAETSKIIDKVDDLGPIKRNFYNKPSHLSKRELKVFDNSYFKFCFVRNPYSRVVSAYLDKICDTSSSQYRLVASTLNKSGNKKISFDEFLSFLENGGINNNVHWARQTDLIALPLKKFDYVGKTETIEKDLSFILKTIFGRECDIISVRDHKTKSDKVMKALNDLLTKRIFRLYKSDFECFKYK